MAYSCWKINTLIILFVMLFSLFVIPVYAQSQKEVFDISKGRLTQTWPSKDMQKLLPSLSVDSGQSVVDHLLEYAFQFKGRPYCRGYLVFFKGRNSTSSRVGHVGLVSEVLPGGKFKFIHASCSKGICEESSDALYYAKRYVGARRVIESDHSSALLKE